MENQKELERNKIRKKEEDLEDVRKDTRKKME
jgi:hypothetical protein